MSAGGPGVPPGVPAAPGPLAGVFVLDLTQNVAGPYCTMQLADLGADVLKVEPVAGGKRAGFITLNRSKRSLAVDLKAPAGRALGERLAARADVLVENFRPGVMERLGPGWEALHALNPGLVFASISGFGDGSPYGELGGLDLIAQGMSGLMSATGEGQRVETSLLDAGLGLSVWEAICGTLGCEELLADARFQDNHARRLHREERAELLSARAREHLVPQEHPTAGPVRVLGVPYKLGATPAGVRTPAPTLGRHTDEALAALGYGAGEIEELRAKGVVA